MADEIETLDGQQLLIQIEKVPGSGNFEHDCLINAERSIEFSADAIQTVVAKCTDPNAPAWKRTQKDGLTAAISGEGMTHISSLPFFDSWFRGADAYRVRARINKPGVDWYWQGSFHCMNFRPAGGTRKQVATASVALVSDGEVTREIITP